MVSVVVPVYNGQKSLAECLNSIANQKLKDIEILVVDNNSTDGTPVIIKSFCEKDCRFRSLTCQQQGVSHARNTGIEAAKGDYIFFFDGDDLLPENALSELLEAAEKYNTDITFGNIVYCREDKKQIMDKNGRDALIEHDNIPGFFKEKLSSYILYFVFKLYKKNLIDANNLRFDAQMRIGEDLLFNLSAFEQAESIYYIANPLSLYKIDNGGLNTKYHPDLIKDKLTVHYIVKDYLVKHGVFDDSYYAVLINDVFAMMVNETKAVFPDINKILKLECVAELKKSKIFGRLSFIKKIFYMCVKLNMKRTLRFFAVRRG